MKKRSIIIQTIYFFLLFSVSLSVHTLTERGNVLWNLSAILRVVGISLFVSLLAGFLSGSFTAYCEAHKSSLILRKTNSFSFFLMALLTILAVWSIFYLAYYPGLLVYDSPTQMEQIIWGAYNNHHPLYHTLLIKAFLDIASAFNLSLNAGVAMYVAMQMTALALVFAYGCFLVAKYISLAYGWMLTFLIAIFPLNGYMAVSVTKDIYFSLFSLLFLLSIWKLLFVSDATTKMADYIFLAISNIGIILFRNNGKYALAVFFIFLILALVINRKGALRNKLIFIGITLIACIFIGLGLLKVADSKVNADQGDAREMLSIPIQQLARTYVYHGGLNLVKEDDNSLSDTEKALLNEFMLDESYKQYRMDISDPVKKHTNTYVVRYKFKDFIATYINLFTRYESDYINAFLGVNAGFLDPFDETHAHINEVDGMTGYGYIQTAWSEERENAFGFFKETKWENANNHLDNFADNNQYLSIPILKYIFMPGIYFWALFLFISIKFIKKNYLALLPAAYLVGYYATCLFGPTVQLRYVFPVMICVPFLFVLNLYRGD